MNILIAITCGLSCLVNALILFIFIKTILSISESNKQMDEMFAKCGETKDKH